MKKSLFFIVVLIAITQSIQLAALFKKEETAAGRMAPGFFERVKQRFGPQQPVMVPISEPTGFRRESGVDFLYQHLNNKMRALDQVRKRKEYFIQQKDIDEINKIHKQEIELLRDIQAIKDALMRAGAPV